MNVEKGALVKQETIIPTFAVSTEEASRRLKELQGFIRGQMKEGEDFGKIPGCPKPSLFKPGAEKLCSIYGFAPKFETVEQVKDWEKGFFHYQLKCELVCKRSGVTVAEGVGSCNSREKRYKNQDAYTIDNTILKMAKKRALIDATLTATRTSGLFTQDVEDIVDHSNGGGQPQPRSNGTPQVASQKQVGMIHKLKDDLNWDDETYKSKLSKNFGVESAKDLTIEQASSLITAMLALQKKG